MAGLMFHRPRPRALEKADRRASIEAIDRAESEKVKVRSGGRCEAMIDGARCRATAWQIHLPLMAATLCWTCDFVERRTYQEAYSEDGPRTYHFETLRRGGHR